MSSESHAELLWELDEYLYKLKSTGTTADGVKVKRRATYTLDYDMTQKKSELEFLPFFPGVNE